MSAIKTIKNPKKFYKILITAGPTIEPLDPVRYISNYSTGQMGYEISSECARRGLKACLISGPSHLAVPPGVKIVNVKTAREMRREVINRIGKYDCIIMAAAVCDFRPERKEKNKIKKKNVLELRLIRNPDILLEIGRREDLVKVGFALETESPVKNAREKVRTKSLDLMVINMKGRRMNPFGAGKKDYMIINAQGNRVKEFKKVTKKQMAEKIIAIVEKLLYKKNET